MRRTVTVAVVSGMLGALLATPVVVYASHQFNDVPNSHLFHSAISWMKDNNVTIGCNPPTNTNFCPDENVTRGQISAFFKRLSEGEIVNAATAVNADSADSAVNADKVDGKHLSQFAPRAAFNSTTDAPDGANFTLSTQITAPAPGVLLISGGIDAFNDTSVDTYRCLLEVDNSTVTGSVMWSRLNYHDVDVNHDEDCTTSGAATVNAGTYVIDLEVGFVAATTSLNQASVWVMWVPFDGNGNTPTAVSGLSDSPAPGPVEGE